MHKRLVSALFLLTALAASLGVSGEFGPGSLVTDLNSHDDYLVIASEGSTLTMRKVNIAALRAYVKKLHKETERTPPEDFVLTTAELGVEEFLEGDAVEVTDDTVQAAAIPFQDVEPAGRVAPTTQVQQQQGEADDVAGSGCCGCKGWKPNWGGFGAREIFRRNRNNAAAAPASSSVSANSNL